MKKLITVLAVLFIAQTNLQAQSAEEEIDLMQSVFGMEKKEMYANFITAKGPVADNFWALYDEYETKRKALGKNRIALLKDYADNYGSHDPKKLDSMMEAIIKQKSSLDKLINQYYKKIRASAGSKAAAQFLQLETFILAATRITIMENIPFIGELERE
jgi:transcription termination factor NusB